MRGITKLFSIIGVLFLFSVASAQAETITQNTATASNLGLYGGEVRYLAIDETSDYMYVGTYSPNGIFVSPDNGETWEGVPIENNFGEPRGVAVNDAGDLFIVVGAGVFKSSDRGETFTEMPGIGAYGGVLEYANDELAIGRTDGGVSISTNEGESFVTRTLLSGGNVISLGAGVTSGTWYAVVEANSTSTLYRTTNSGVSWSEVNTDDVTGDFYLIAVDPNDSSHLFLTSSEADSAPWHSTDGGSTWAEISGVTPYATRISFDSSGRVYMGVDYSDNDGASWSQVEQATPSSRVSGIVVPDPQNDNVLFAGSFAALAKSTNRGTSWVDRNEGITAVTARDIAQSIDKQTVWVATNAGLAKTENFLSESPDWKFPIYYDSYPQSVWVSPSDPETVVVGGMGAIVKTTDGGATWETATGWDSDLTAMQIIHNPENPDRLFAVGNVQNTEIVKTGGVYTSVDGGETWTTMSFPGNRPAQTIARDPGGRIYVGVGNINLSGASDGGVYMHNDGEWSALGDFPDAEVTSVAVDPNDSNVLYATVADFNTYGASSDTTSGLYRSENRGVNWDRITDDGLSDATKFLDIETQPAGGSTTLYLSGMDKLSNAGVIYKSKNAGTTWGTYYTGLKNEKFNRLLFDGLIAGNTRGLYGIEAKAKLTISTKRKKVRKGKKIVVRVTLKDAATKKRLKKRRVVLMRAVGQKKKFKVFKKDKTNKRGVAVYSVRVRKNVRFKARFVPKKAIDKEEYTRSLSKKMRVTVRKN